jgi:hypothetical protein
MTKSLLTDLSGIKVELVAKVQLGDLTSWRGVASTATVTWRMPAKIVQTEAREAVDIIDQDHQPWMRVNAASKMDMAG